MDAYDPTSAFARAVLELTRQHPIFNDPVLRSRMFATLADGAVTRSLLAGTRWSAFADVGDIVRRIDGFDRMASIGWLVAKTAVAQMAIPTGSLALQAFGNMASAAWLASAKPLLAEDTDTYEAQSADEEPWPVAFMAEDNWLLETWRDGLRSLWAWMQTRQARGLAAAVGITVLTAWWIPFARAHPDLANAVSGPVWTVVAILFAMAVADQCRKD